MNREMTVLRNSFAALAAIFPFVVLAEPYAPLEHHTFMHDGVEREYFVHAPERQEPLPVVIAIHGYTSTATGFAVFHDLRAHAEEHDYIVVYPQGTHFVDAQAERPYRITSWNMLGDAMPAPDAGPQCIEDAYRYPCPPECGECDRCGWASCYDDVGYFEKVMEEVAANYRTDARRYYALGMSNGGMMTLRLGCSMPGQFAAIAPIDAQMPAGFDCGPDHSLPMLLLYGGQDNTVRPDGQAGEDGFVYVSVAETTATWADAMQCESGPAAWLTAATEKVGMTCTAYTDCAVSRHEVVSCGDPDETHNWPGRRPGGAWPTCVTGQQHQVMPEQPLCEARTGYGPHLGMDVIWEFFRRFERPASPGPEAQDAALRARPGSD